MDATLLIADPDTARSRQIADACALRGFGCRTVADGAQALDAALAEVPDALLLTDELPLISGTRLAEILRANPRTQGVRLLRLERGERGPAAASFGEALRASEDADAVARRIEELLARGARLRAVERDARQEVQGRLAQIPLADLLQLLHLNRRTGTISLRRRTTEGRSERGRIHVREGEVVQAVAGRVEAEKAVFRLLAWSDGAFVFRPEPVRLAARIATPTRALLMDALRQLDESRELCDHLPAREAAVSLRVPRTELPDVVHPVTQEVLLLLEIYERVGDVVDHCSYPDFQVLRTLQTLAERGLVEIASARAGRTSGPGLLSPAELRRLREWLAPSDGAGLTLRDAKLLVAAADDGTWQAFVAWLARAPGVSLAPDAASGARPALGPVARIALDGELGLELVHVSPDAAVAAVWPLAGYGALGAWLLVPERAAGLPPSLHALSTALGGVPRLRLVELALPAADHDATAPALAPTQESGAAEETLRTQHPRSRARVRASVHERPEAALHAALSRCLP